MYAAAADVAVVCCCCQPVPPQQTPTSVKSDAQSRTLPLPSYQSHFLCAAESIKDYCCHQVSK